MTAERWSIAADHYRHSPTLGRPAQPIVAETQPADGPGVTWWRGQPWCSTCATPLNDISTANNDGTVAGHPLNVRACPMGCGTGSDAA